MENVDIKTRVKVLNKTRVVERGKSCITVKAVVRIGVVTRR